MRTSSEKRILWDRYFTQGFALGLTWALPQLSPIAKAVKQYFKSPSTIQEEEKAISLTHRCVQVRR